MITHLGLDVGTSKIAAAFYDPQLTPAQGGAIQLFSLGDRGVLSTSTLIDLESADVVLGSREKPTPAQIALESEKIFMGLFSEQARQKGRREEWLRAQEMRAMNRAYAIGPTESQITFFTAKDRAPQHQMQLRPYRILALRLLGILQSIGQWEQREQGQYKGVPQDHLLPELQYVGLAIPTNFDASCRSDLLNAMRMALLMLWSTYHTSQTTRDTLQACIKNNADLDLELFGLLDQAMASSSDTKRDIDSLIYRLEHIQVQILEEPVASFCSFLYEDANAREQLGLPRRAASAPPEGTSHIAVLDGGAGTCDLILLRLQHRLISAADDRFDPQISLDLFPIDANRELSMPGMHHLDRLFALRCFEDGPLGLPFWLIDKHRDVFSRRLLSEEFSEEQLAPLLLDDIDHWFVSILRDDAEFGLWASLVRNTLCNIQQGVQPDKPDVYFWCEDGSHPPINPLEWDQHQERIRSLRSMNIEKRIHQWGWMTAGALGRRLLALLQRWARHLFDTDPVLTRAREDFILAMARWISEVRYQIVNTIAAPAEVVSDKPYQAPDGRWILPSRRRKTPPPPTKRALKPDIFQARKYALEFDTMDEDTLLQVCRDQVEKLEVACEIKRFEFDKYSSGMQCPVLISGGLYHYKPIWERLAGPLLRNAAGEYSRPLTRHSNSRPELDVALGSCWAGVDLGEGYLKRFFFRPELNVRLYIGAPTIGHNHQYMVASEERHEQQFLFWMFSDAEMNQPNLPIPIGEARPAQGYCVIPFQRDTRNLFDQTGTPEGFQGEPYLKQQGFPHFQVRVDNMPPQWVQIKLHYFDHIIVRRTINPDRSYSLSFCPVVQGQEHWEHAHHMAIHFPPHMDLRNLFKVAAVMRWGEPIRGQSYRFFQCMSFDNQEHLYELSWL